MGSSHHPPPPIHPTTDNRIEQFWRWLQATTLRVLESDFMQGVTERLATLYVRVNAGRFGSIHPSPSDTCARGRFQH